MNFYVVGMLPSMAPLVKAACESAHALETAKSQMRAVLPKQVAEQVERAIEKQNTLSQTGLLQAVYAAAVAGEDFSQAKTAGQVEDICVQAIAKRMFGLFGSGEGGPG